jgi:iron-regulated transporter 1
VGRFLDSCPERLSAATRLYWIQHGFVALSCAAAAAALPARGALRAVLAAVVLLGGAAGGVGASGSSISVERDFTFALCGADAAALAALNARMRAVDLSCLLLAPIAAALLLQLCGAPLAVLAFAACNFAVFFPECRLLSAAVASSPELQQPRAAAAAAADKASSGGGSFRDAWAVYTRQRVFPAALALALLYFTVLSLGFLMTAYLHWRGVSDVAISIFRGFGAASGLAATAAFPRVARAAPLARIAAVAVAMQLTWLLVGVLPTSLAAAPSAPLLRLLMASLALSRFGLWLCDLAVSQLLQDGVPAAELGTVNGVQSAVCAAFEMLSFVAGLALHRPQQFPALMLGSCGAVATSAALLAWFALRAARERTPEGQAAVQLRTAETHGLLADGDAAVA